MACKRSGVQIPSAPHPDKPQVKVPAAFFVGGVGGSPVTSAGSPGVHAGEECGAAGQHCRTAAVSSKRPRKPSGPTAGPAGRDACGGDVRPSSTVGQTPMKQEAQRVTAGIPVPRGGEEVKNTCGARCRATGRPTTAPEREP